MTMGECQARRACVIMLHRHAEDDRNVEDMRHNDICVAAYPILYGVDIQSSHCYGTLARVREIVVGLSN